MMNETSTRHSHDPLPFGRKVPAGQCPRCDELRAGAPARAGYGSRARRYAAQDAAARAAHFAPGGPHARGACGPVCTAFDW